ncbi:PCYCGC domain-containing protein [bacterium]|nr:PCYCGC domain-containing protein [bacterium]
MKNEEKKPSSSISPLAIIAFGLVLIAIATYAVLVKKDEPAQTQTEHTHKHEPVISVPQGQTAPASTETKSVDFKIPPFNVDVDNVTLQPVKDPATVSPAAKASYVVVQNDPKLIAQLPCFCYCERFGHTSLHDCFVSDHAEICDICMKEALQADQLAKQGLSPLEIRETIIAEFHPRENTDHSGHDHD